MGTMAAPDSGTPCLAHLGGSSYTCYFYQAITHPGPETLPEEVEVRAPHESECKVTRKVMPLGQFQTWPCCFLRGRISSISAYSGLRPPGARNSPDWLSQVPTFPTLHFSCLVLFFFALIVPFWDVDIAANPGTKQGMETVWGNNSEGGAHLVSVGRGRGVMWGLCKTFPAGARVSGDRLLKQ